jgi:hypothetical protein
MEAPLRGKVNRLFVLIVILLAAAALYFSGLLTPGQIQIDIKKEVFIRSNFNFIAEHWSEQKLEQLREREDYKDLQGVHQFDLFLKLCNWVHNQWQRSVPNPYPLNNALDILNDIRSKKTGGFCGQYAFVLADVLKSLGFFNVRYVELWSNNGRSHFVVEVWSDMYQKWLVLDADYNIYYEMVDTKIPTGSLEVRASLFGGPDVVARSAVKGTKVAGNLQKELYANFAVSMRSDLMRNTRPLTVGDRFRTFVFFKDKHTNPRFYGQMIPYRLITSRIQDLYYDCNFVRITHKESIGEKQVWFAFSTESSMPHFKSFMVRINQGSWQTLGGHSYVLELTESPLRLDVAAVNVFNRMGCVNSVVVNF